MTLVSHGRAALLCFGGWGLQTMLHLWPRLRFVQEERAYLGLENHLPDLGRLTAFAALIPNPVVSDTPARYVPLHLVQPEPARTPPPFYVERLLNRVNAEPRPVLPQRTEAEMRTWQLFQQARQDGYLRSIPLQLPVFEHLEPGARVPRSEMFQIGISSAGTIARALQRHVIDPTRLDAVQAHDPLVQTSLYVIASLVEPDVSPLIWPVLSELVESLGRKTVVKVIGLFATGSFAQDDTHVIEEAATYAALTELEALTGVARRTPHVHGLLQKLVASAEQAGWERRIGRRLFDRIYLLDREKSNQALARDPFELAVLASNAIETFLVADANSHIERQLGPDSYGEGSQSGPYSLIGAASDYVPLAQYILAAVQEEQKRILREEVLRQEHGQTGQNGQHASLQDLALTPGEVVGRLRTTSASGIFEPESFKPPVRRRGLRMLWRPLIAPRWTGFVRQNGQTGQTGQHSRPEVEQLPELRVARAYILPAPVARKLNHTGSLLQWRALIEERIKSVDNRLQHTIETRQFEREWGLTYFAPAYRDNELPRAIGYYSEHTWAMRYQQDRRVLPAAVLKAVQTVVSDMCASPDGILRARAKLNQWIAEVDTILSRQYPKDSSAERAEWSASSKRDAKRQWEHYFIRVAGMQPRQPALLIRSLMLWLFLTYLLFGWLDIELALPQHFFFATLSARTGFQSDLVILALVATFSALLTSVAHWFVTDLHNERATAAREQRITLAQRDLSQRANRIVRQNLYRVYQQARIDLSDLRAVLNHAVEELEAWAQTADIERAPVPPADIETIHLHRPHTPPGLWPAIKALVQQETAAEDTGQSRFFALWQQDGTLQENWHTTGTLLAQRIRLALELPLNEREIDSVLMLVARQRRIEELVRAQHAVVPETHEQAMRGLKHQLQQDLAGGTWCGYATPAASEHLPARCVACPNLQRYACPFSSAGAAQRDAWSLSAIIREYVERATEHIISEQRGLPEQRDVVRHIFETYGIEQLLFDQEHALLSDGARIQGQQHSFTEDMYARAKPAASYDLSGTLSYQVLEVDFGVTAEAETSALRQPFEQRHMHLLSSYDPISVSAVRTVNGLHLRDLILTGRCALAYLRLNDANRQMLTLPHSSVEIETFYGRGDGQIVPHEKISF